MISNIPSPALYGSDDTSLRYKEQDQYAADIEQGLNTRSSIDVPRTPSSHTACDTNVDSRDFADASAIVLPVGCPSMGKHRPLPPWLSDGDAYIVEFDGPADPEQPYNWKLSTK